MVFFSEVFEKHCALLWLVMCTYARCKQMGTEMEKAWQMCQIKWEHEHKVTFLSNSFQHSSDCQVS